jgi:hypothetical protein
MAAGYRSTETAKLLENLGICCTIYLCSRPLSRTAVAYTRSLQCPCAKRIAMSMP